MRMSAFLCLCAFGSVAMAFSGGCVRAGLDVGRPAVPASEASKIALQIIADRLDPVYKCGETATFLITVANNGKPVTEGQVRVVLSLDGGRKIAEKTVALKLGAASAGGTLDEPGFLLCTASLTLDGVEHTGCNSAAFEPERIQTAATVPEDFDKFWAEGRARVDAIPMDLQLTPIPAFSDDKQETFKLSMANIDDTRIYGYLSVPKGRTPPYPALVSVPGAGVGAPYEPLSSAAAEGALALFMGVHTHDLGLSEAEYTALREGPLRNYGRQGIPDREKYFFRRAILGIDRAVRYLTTRPDWDGKHLVYFGSSQGGGMGLILAGLNPQFNGIVVNVPAMCDRNSYRAGRGAGWPPSTQESRTEEQQQYEKMVEYFDAVNFARKIRCPVLMSAGFMDRTCPASGIYSAFNVIAAPKRMFHGPSTGHAGVTAFPVLKDYFDPWLNGQMGLSAPLPPTAE